MPARCTTPYADGGDGGGGGGSGGEERAERAAAQGCPRLGCAMGCPGIH